MADVSNLKIDHRSNVEWLNLRVTKIHVVNKNLEDKASILIYIKGKYEKGKIASDAEYRMDEKFTNLSIFGIFIVF